MEGGGPVTLQRLAAFAAFLARIRPIFFGAGIVAIAWLVFEVGWGTRGSARALLALSAVLGIGIALAAGFTLAVLPRGVRPGDGLGVRIRQRFARFAYVAALLLCLGLLGLATSLAFRAIGVAAD